MCAMKSGPNLSGSSTYACEATRRQIQGRSAGRTWITVYRSSALFSSLEGRRPNRPDPVWNASLDPNRHIFVHTNGARLPPAKLGLWKRPLMAPWKSTSGSCRLRYVEHSGICLSSHGCNGSRGGSSVSSRQARECRSIPRHFGFCRFCWTVSRSSAFRQIS